MRRIHLANEQGRDATLNFVTSPKPPTPRLGVAGKKVRFQRYVAATPTSTHEQLSETHGSDYGQALIDGDPDADIEYVGRAINEAVRVFLTSEGEVMHVAPNMVEVILEPDGSERERRVPQDVPSNVEIETPLTWTGRKMDKREAVHRFVFGRTVSLRHTDGLTFDFLHAMAKSLAESNQVVLIAAGPKGKQPLIFQDNGSPYRAFLEGRVDGERFLLLLHLSNMELKLPASKEEA